MTRPSKGALVLDGNVVKQRLEAERIESNSMVHVDWLRFTAQLRNAPFPHVDLMFPKTSSIWDDDYRMNVINRTLSEIPREEFTASAQALELAHRAASALGPDYAVNPERRKGHDFYRFRWSIEREGHECGWVGFLASSESPRQQAQARTLHVNLYGTACTFASAGWRDRMADLVDEAQADVTRCDLALDFFDGLSGGMQRVWTDYDSGLCNSGGKKLKMRDINWLKGSSRSIYLGSKEAGKETNIYEKGQQLFGDDSAHPWIRAELRYGNKLRVLSSDMLRRPADFFAGASEWHATLLAEAGEVVVPEPVKCDAQLPLMTVEAEVYRVKRWFERVAAPAASFLFRHMPDTDFLPLVSSGQKPGRLERFSESEAARAMQSVIQKFMGSESCPAPV